GRARRVGLRVGVARLDLRDGVPRVRLGRRVLRLLLLTEEARQRDRGEDADDQDDDEQLDQREALLVANGRLHGDPVVGRSTQNLSTGVRLGVRTPSTTTRGGPEGPPREGTAMTYR